MKDVSAEIISVGSEILLGQIVNTNASYLAKKLSEIGVDLFYQSVVGDNPRRLSAALKNALARSDIVITTGGLGPTVDDITISAISEVTSRPLVLNDDIWKNIKIFFKRRRIKMHSYVSRQARVPEGALAIENPVGTAPGVIIGYDDKTIVALPGPPRELMPIFENGVIPYLKKRYKTRSIIFTRSIRTLGAPESVVNKKIRSFLMMAGALTVGIYARPNEVDVKITAKSLSKKQAMAQIRKVEKKILNILGDLVYGFDDETIESAVGKMLIKRKMTLSVAESCTGGLISDRITNVSGSSKYFDMAVITYSNDSKIKELGVNKELIKKYGAVSREVAVSMAKGMLEKSGSDVALAVTGIAGPTGGTKKKPVGLVYIALASKKSKNLGQIPIFERRANTAKIGISPYFCHKCIERRFIGNRTDVKYQASTAALDLLRKTLS